MYSALKAYFPSVPISRIEPGVSTKIVTYLDYFQALATLYVRAKNYVPPPPVLVKTITGTTSYTIPSTGMYYFEIYGGGGTGGNSGASYYTRMRYEYWHLCPGGNGGTGGRGYKYVSPVYEISEGTVIYTNGNPGRPNFVVIYYSSGKVQTESAAGGVAGGNGQDAVVRGVEANGVLACSIDGGKDGTDNSKLGDPNGPAGGAGAKSSSGGQTYSSVPVKVSGFAGSKGTTGYVKVYRQG
jgi:hypothetical protein